MNASDPRTPDPAAADGTDTASDGTPRAREYRRSPAFLATVVALPVALLGGLIVAAAMINSEADDAPLTVGAVPAPDAESEQCASVLRGVPDTLGGVASVALAEPAPAGVKAWRESAESQAIILRCGTERPAEFDVAAALQVVDGVQWFQVSGAAQGFDASTYYAVDRGVYIAVTVPDGTGPTPIQELSAAIAAALPARPLDPAPLPEGAPPAEPASPGN